MKKINFNEDWQFWKEGGDRQNVTLPHDAMIHEQRDSECKNGKNTGYFPGGYYFYEKNFMAEIAWQGQKVLLSFGGVYQRTRVYLNGEPLYFEPYGYTGFALDLSEHLRYGEENLIRVEVDNAGQANSRWYSGSGIYRKVWLMVGACAGLLRDNVRVQTLSLHPVKVRVTIASAEKNQLLENKDYHICLKDADNILAEAQGKDVTLTLDDVKLWSAETPDLYELEIDSQENGIVIDQLSFSIGICKLEWSTQGLFVNGIMTKLRGACIHHDNGILGACEYKESAERRVRILKKAGFNAIRSAHNPISEELLDACDKYGMYVMDEFADMWYEHKNRYDYACYFEEYYEKDLTAMVQKDFSHPSVIMYSIGNEVTETKEESGIHYTKAMTDLCHAQDDSRPVTCGINMALNVMHFAGMGVYQPAEGDPVRPAEAKNPKALQMMMEMAKHTKMPQKTGGDTGEAGTAALGLGADMGQKKDGHLVGSEYFNKMMVEMKGQQQQVVTQPIAKVLSEDAYAALDIAGYNYADNRYLRDAEEYPERISVGTETLPPKIGINWKIIEQCPNILGDFMWTGWDYLGEAGVGAYVYDSVGNKNGAFPALLAGSGVIDICGHCRPEVYLNQVAYGLEKGPFLSVEPINHSKEDHLISAWRYSDSIRSWSWEGYEENPANLVIYGMGAYVEVFLNENKIGRADFKDYKAVLDTVYEPGEIKAVSYDEKGQEIGRDILRTASDKTQIQMTLSKEEVRAEDVEICYVDLALTDEDGLWKPGAEVDMKLEVSGNAKILAYGNANPFGNGAFDLCTQPTYYGRTQAVIRMPKQAGDVIIKASTENLETTKVIKVC